MLYEEMLERAKQMRSRDLFGAVSNEEIEKIAFMQTERYVPIDEENVVHVYEIRPKNLSENAPMIINFHGGGFIKGRQAKDQLFCSKMADRYQCLVWDVDYSLAPENQYPFAVNESYAVVAYAFLHANDLGVDEKRIILMGHSAGGNLVATVCLKANETKLFKPKAIVMEFCPLDLYTDPAKKPRAEGDMPAEVAKTYNAFYCSAEMAENPYVSPIFASEEALASFPDTLMISAKLDSLCFEDEEFALKLIQAGVSVTAKRFQNSHHGFTINRTDDWEEAMELIYEFVEKHLK